MMIPPAPTRTHLVVGTPCYGGQVTSLYTTSLLKLQQACTQRGDIDLTVKLLGGDALITRARQNLVAHFLEIPTATHLLFIDGDIGFEPDQAFRLLSFGVDMVAGVYPTKKIDWDKVGSAAKEGKGGLESAALSYVIEMEKPEKLDFRAGFIRVRFAGTGFLMIKRQALVKMIEHYPQLSYAREHQAEDPLRGSRFRCALFNCFIDQGTGAYLSEDFSFCRRWTDMGGEIWADLNSRLTHSGPITFSGNVSSQFPEMPK